MSKFYTGTESRALWDAAGAPELRRCDCEYDDHTRVEYVGALGKWTLIDAAPVPVADLVSAAPDLSRSVEHWEARALAAESALLAERENHKAEVYRLRSVEGLDSLLGPAWEP